MNWRNSSSTPVLPGYFIGTHALCLILIPILQGISCFVLEFELMYIILCCSATWFIGLVWKIEGLEIFARSYV